MNWQDVEGCIYGHVWVVIQRWKEEIYEMLNKRNTSYDWNFTRNLTSK